MRIREDQKKGKSLSPLSTYCCQGRRALGAGYQWRVGVVENTGMCQKYPWERLDPKVWLRVSSSETRLQAHFFHRW